MPEAVYRNLISTVHDHLGGFYDYMKLRREVMKLDKLDMFDMYNPLLPAAAANTVSPRRSDWSGRR